MIIYKTEKELKAMEECGKILRDAFKKTLSTVKPGISTLQIDQTAEKLIHEAGATPAFKRVSGYSWSTCICINSQVVHTPPSKTILRNGDAVTVDMGVFYKGFNTDKADTVIVGEGDKKIKTFLQVGRDALKKALEAVRVGNRIGHISEVIQDEVERGGYYVIRDLTGHGVGTSLHEEPFIPGVLRGSVEKTPKIKPGMALAVEVIYAQSKTGIMEEKGATWSLTTVNGSMAACFEETIGVFENKTSILT